MRAPVLAEDEHLAGIVVTVTHPNGCVETVSIMGYDTGRVLDGVRNVRAFHAPRGAVVTTRQVWLPRVCG